MQQDTSTGPRAAGHKCRPSCTKKKVQALMHQDTSTGPRAAGHKYRPSCSRTQVQALVQQDTSTGPRAPGHKYRPSCSRTQVQALVHQDTSTGPRAAGHKYRPSCSRTQVQALMQQDTSTGPRAPGHKYRPSCSRTQVQALMQQDTSTGPHAAGHKYRPSCSRTQTTLSKERLMMSLRMAPPLLLLVFLLMVVGASGPDWIVTGSGVDPTDLSVDPDYSGRVECLTDNKTYYSLKLSNVTKKDQNKYSFRIKTDDDKKKWMGKPYVILNVTELHVESPGEVTEGESAVLTCKTTCSLTDPTFIWYKDGRPLTTEMIQKNQQLHLQTVSSEDAGSFSCAVRGSEHLPSTAQTLRVRHPPKNVSVSISPSGGIVEGSSVTLNCSSDGYPPVENYTWFKEGGDSPVGSGQSFSIISITVNHTGLYYCEAQNAVGVQNGSVMIGVQKNQIRSAVWITVGGGGGFLLLLLFILILIFISRMKKRDAGSDQDGSDQDDVQYATVTHSRSRPVETAGDASSGAPDHDDDVQYATVRTGRKPDVVIRSDQQEELQYASVTFHHRHADAAATGSEKVDDASVIYDRIK
ncbi:B-cell receptor CD22-like [Astyanax mexicanus]|uniref:B-cell receptor CD22-like n=1 Tax=Astyanax mexicanus TaxID=7994 RepID=A0A8T2KTY0_ASTMX|nr:B-cell receptor CD22-like [Astyanax mexicanus]